LGFFYIKKNNKKTAELSSNPSRILRLVGAVKKVKVPPPVQRPTAPSVSSSRSQDGQQGPTFFLIFMSKKLSHFARRIAGELAIREDDLPPNMWKSLAMKRHPDVLEVIERVRPLSRGPTFARLCSVGRTEVRENLSREFVLQLIMQHLISSGFRSTCKVSSSKISIIFLCIVGAASSNLHFLKKIKKIADFASGSKSSNEILWDQ
jgi:hypothetical protein